MSKSTAADIEKRAQKIKITGINIRRGKTDQDHYMDFIFKDGISLRVTFDEATLFSGEFKPWSYGGPARFMP